MLNVYDSTLIYDSSSSSGIYLGTSSTLFYNTLVDDHIAGTLGSSSSNNFIVDGSGGLTNGVNGNLLNQGANLQSINGYDGYFEPGPGSPAIDAGNNSYIPSGITTDIRGSGYARIAGSRVDIGAIETSGFSLVFTTQPAGAAANATLATVQVAVEDGVGNVLLDGSTINLSLSGGTGTLSGTTYSQYTDEEQATYSNLSISAPGTYQLVASDSTDFGTTTFSSNSFVISAPLSTTLINVQFADFNGNYTGPAVIGSSGDYWNTIRVGAAVSGYGIGLSNSNDGSTGGATLSYSGTAADSFGINGFNFTPYANLMGGALAGGNGYLSFSGLSGSSYNVYLYSAGNSSSQTTFSNISGSKTAQNYFQSSSFVSGQNYVELTNVPANYGSLYISFYGSPGIINGIQLQSLSTASPLVLTGNSPHYLVKDASIADLDVYNNSLPSGPFTQYPISGISSVSVAEGVSSSDTLTLDFSNGNPFGSSINVSYNGGANLNVVGQGGSNAITAFGNSFDYGTTAIALSNSPTVDFDPGSDQGDALDVFGGFVHLEPVALASGSVALLFSSLTVESGATLTVAYPNQPTVVTTNTLSIAGTTGNWTGQLDLTSDDLIVAAGSATDINDQLKSGFNNGAWNGEGIISSSAAVDSTMKTTLGMDLYSANNTFEGQSVTAGNIAIKYTWYGDADLSGKVDGSDYSRIDSGFMTHATGFYNGDFNYDGVINGSDYTLIDNLFNSQGTQIAAKIAPATVNRPILFATQPLSMESIERKSTIDDLLDSWEGASAG